VINKRKRALKSICLLPLLAWAIPHILHADQVISPVERVQAATPVPSSAFHLNNAPFVVDHDDSIDFDQTDSFTLETWLFIDSFNKTDEIIAGKGDSYLLRRSWQTGKLTFSTRFLNTLWLELTTSEEVPLGSWFHVAVTYDSDTQEKRIYINGVLDASNVASDISKSTRAFRAGVYGVDASNSDGRIDNLRIWNTARTPSELLADIDRKLTGIDQDSSAIDRSVPGLVAEWRFDQVTLGKLQDSSGNGLDGTATGVVPLALVDGLHMRDAPPIDAVSPGALAFDGTPGSLVTVPDQALLNLSGALTLESWVYLDAFDQPWQAIVTKGNDWGLTRNDETSQVAFRTSSGASLHDLVGATELLPGRWYHLAATWDGQDKRLYLDGVLDAKAPWSGSLDASSDDLTFGGNAASANREFKGKIDSVRVWALARSSEEIDVNRFEQQRGFENGLRGAWRFDEDSGPTARDVSYLANHGTLAGGVTRLDGLSLLFPTAPVSDLPSPDGGALYFPSDLALKSTLVLPADERLDVVDSITVEAWVSISSFSDKPQGVITKGQSWGLIIDPVTNTLNFQTRKGSLISELKSSVPLQLDVWHHIAAVFDGSRKTLYINGVLDASADLVGTLEANSLDLNPLDRVAFSGNFDSRTGQVSFHGRVDSVRLWSDARTQSELNAEAVRELRGTEPGLIGAWRFEDGIPANDSSWNRLHGILAGSPAQYAPQIVSGLLFTNPPEGPLALDFNRDPGDQDFVNVSADPLFNFSTQMSVETWVYIDAVPLPGESSALISKGDTAWELRLEANGKINFYTAGVTLNDILDEDNLPQPGTPFPDFLSVARIDPGTWYHVAAIWDGNSKTKEIYLNGQLDNSRDDLEAAIATNTRPVLLAARPLDDSASAQAARFSGVLDETRLWNIALPGEQIRTAFNNELHGNELGLVGYWPFSQGGRASDGSEALSALDETVAPRAAIDGAFSSSMGILNRVPGILLGPPGVLQYTLAFNGVDEYLEVPASAAFEPAGGSLTIEVWINPLGAGFRTIVMQGDHGYGLALDDQNRLRYFIDGNPINSLASTGTVTNGEWQHVAVVVDGEAGVTTFYINGQAAGELPVANITIKSGEALIIGKQGPFGGNYYQGLMDELRIWHSTRSPSEMEFFAQQPLTSGNFPDLAAYWQFNEGRDQVGGNLVPASPEASLMNMDDSNWRLGHIFPSGSIDQSLNLSPVPGLEGLWMGRIVLTQVNEVQTAIGGESTSTSATGDSLTVRIILHADASGAVNLLKDVIVMRTPVDPANPGQPQRLVLVTDPLLIANFEGVVERNGKLVGQRFGSVDYDFDGLELALLGGLLPGSDLAGRITLGKNHPTNPFRHKQHPQHGSGFDITRQFSLSFDTTAPDPATAKPGFGTDWITGTYRETITGLHKIPLKTSGRLILSRINQIEALNQ
jgi:hypothetical protein